MSAVTRLVSSVPTAIVPLLKFSFSGCFVT
jgi:hypothetical protein